ncbi:hypothetical protein MK079_02060 [Candidatus Gracilibacteria bacterium]|nr:hypothetical protein [Candidatus Gracilibacteria bacterium]
MSKYPITARLNQHASDKVTLPQEVYDDLVRKLQEKNKDNSELLMLGFYHHDRYIVSGVTVVLDSLNVTSQEVVFSYFSREEQGKKIHVQFLKNSEYGRFIIR